MSEFVILIPPASNAVSLNEIRSYLRIGSDADNAVLAIIQAAAIASIEAKNAKALIKRKVRQSFTNQDIAKAFAYANKMGGAAILRPAFTPDTISEVRSISQNGNSEIRNDLAKITDGLFGLCGPAFQIEIDYFAGFDAPELVPASLKLEVLEEAARLIALRDNEKSQIQKPQVRL